MVTTHTLASPADAQASDVIDEVSRTLESVFHEVARTRDRCERLVASALAEGRAPNTEDLAALRPLLEEQLTAHRELISGAGFIAEPGLLGDVPVWLEWWQTGNGELRPLRLDLDPATSAYSDYTHWEWFALPRATGGRSVSGPYVDYAFRPCTLPKASWRAASNGLATTSVQSFGIGSSSFLAAETSAAAFRYAGSST